MECYILIELLKIKLKNIYLKNEENRIII